MNPPPGEENPKNETTPPSADNSTQSASNTPNPIDSNDNTEPIDTDATQGSLEADGNSASNNDEQKDQPKSSSGIKKIIRKFDIYFLVFIFLVISSLIIAYVAVQKNKTAKQVSITAQTLNQDALSQVNNNDTQVGGTNQRLDIQSDTVFSGNVLVKSGLQIAGSLKVAGTLSLPGITVSGTTDLGQVNANTLTLTGAETIKGSLTVDQGMTVNGIASFSGVLNANSITVSNLQVNADFTYTNHVYATGGIPTDKPNSSIGNGGTSAVNGSDIAGEVNINTGTGPSAGCLVNIAFTKAYSVLPFIVISPVGSAAAASGYYITKTTTGFSICANNPPSGQPMSFDYHIIG